MVKSFNIGTIVEQGSDSKLLNNHLEPELQGETQNESDNGGLLGSNPLSCLKQRELYGILHKLSK